MKLRVVLSTSPLISPFYEDGIEVALTAADMEVNTEVVLTGDFLAYVNSANSDSLVLKKLKQLELYEIEPSYDENFKAGSAKDLIKEVIY